MTDWENGRRCPSTREFLRIADRLGREVVESFAAFHPAVLRRDGATYDIAGWLDALRGSTAIKQIAEQSGFSRFSVQRWISGQADPRLHEFLCLVDVITGRAYDLVATLVPIEQVPALRDRYEAAKTLRSAAYVAPWSEAILRVLESSMYRAQSRHEPGLVAELLGISAAEEDAAINLLARAGILRLKDEIYEVVEGSSVDTRGDKARVTQLLQHWTMVAHARIGDRGVDDFFAYNVFAISSQNLDAAREIMRRAFRELRALVVATPTNERVALANFQLIALDRRSERGVTEGAPADRS